MHYFLKMDVEVKIACKRKFLREQELERIIYSFLKNKENEIINHQTAEII